MLRIITVLLFLPHLLLFYFSNRKEIIIADLYSRSSSRPAHRRTGTDLCLRLFRDKYFRTLFYFRLGGIGSKILRVFYPKEKYFIIDVNTVLGKGVQLAHPYSTILNAEHIGDNLYINHLVTVGEKNGRRPIIGNNVQLNAGCLIIGGVIIGDDAVIGAGAVIVKDVPKNTIAVGNPARIIQK